MEPCCQQIAIESSDERLGVPECALGFVSSFFEDTGKKLLPVSELIGDLGTVTFAYTSLCQYGHQTVALTTFDISIKAINEALQTFSSRALFFESGESGLIQSGYRVSQQYRSHLFFAAGKVVIQAGFAQSGHSGQFAQRRSLITPGQKDRPEFDQKGVSGAVFCGHKGSLSALV